MGSCLSYRVDNNTGSLHSLLYWDCEGNYTMVDLYDGSSYEFCTDTSYGPVDWGPMSITDLGVCVSTSPTPTQTPTNTSTPTTTKTPNPSQTPTTTQTPTNSRTPTNTPTLSKTPTNTPTITQTPSTTPIVCGSGLTTGNHYYTDCCGYLVQGSEVNKLILFDYTKAFNGIVKLNVAGTTSCPTPSPTPTSTVTPSNTQTPTLTLTPTKTSTPTPTKTGAPKAPVVLSTKNDCDVVTIFPMGAICNVVNPTSSTSFDGILSLIITGGTSPYSVYWDTGQMGQTLLGMGSGSFGATIVDFYGDFTARTVCSISAPSPTPSPTTTLTPTPTITPTMISSLCFFVRYPPNPTIGPMQFTYNGIFNAKPSWSYFDGNVTIYIRWNLQQNRWQFYNWPLAGTLVSTSTSNIPTTGWISEGNPTQAVISVSLGACPSYAPLELQLITKNTTCGNVPPYDGSITFVINGGLPPFVYSIDGGQTFSPTNLFTQLRNGNYTCVVKDAAENTQSAQATVNFVATNTSYEISVVSSGVNIINNTNYQSDWVVNVNPELPIGTTLTFSLSVNDSQSIDKPGFATGTMSTSVYKNNTIQTSTNVTTAQTTTGRPNCAPYERETNTKSTIYQLSIQRGDVVSGKTISLESISIPEIGTNGCATRIEQSIQVSVASPVFEGCACCQISTTDVFGGIPAHVLSYNQSTPPIPVPQVITSQLSEPSDYGTSACALNQLITPVYSSDLYPNLSTNIIFYTVNTNSILSSPFVGNSKYYRIAWGGNPSSNEVVQIDNNGYVISLFDCDGRIQSYTPWGGSNNGVDKIATCTGPKNKLLWSNCSTLQSGCIIYTSNRGTGNELLGSAYVFINGKLWTISSQGVLGNIENC